MTPPRLRPVRSEFPCNLLYGWPLVVQVRNGFCSSFDGLNFANMTIVTSHFRFEIALNYVTVQMMGVNSFPRMYAGLRNS